MRILRASPDLDSTHRIERRGQPDACGRPGSAPPTSLAAPAASPLAPWKATPAFLALPLPTQRALDALFGGTHNPRSERARDLLTTAQPTSRIDWPRFLTDLSVSVDALKRECALPAMPPLRSAKLGPARPVANHPFDEGVANADRHDCRLGHLTVPIYTPPGGRAPAERFAAYLAALPDPVLRELVRVDITDQDCRHNAFWAEYYGVPVLAAMSDSASGVLNVYPEAWKQDDQTMIRNVLHEVGHTFTLRRFGDDERGPGWKPWRDAAASDAMAPSYYGSVSPLEDAAETFLLWFVAQGDPSFAEYRRMMPERFALLEKLLTAAGQP